MKYSIITAVVAVCASVSFGQTFTDVNSPQYEGKTADKARNAASDANFALLEDSTATATNGQAITMAASAVVVDGVGGANDTTNTITLANVASTLVGAKVTLVVEASSSNLITIADSGTAKLASAWVADNNDTLTVYVVDTNVFVEVGRSDN